MPGCAAFGCNNRSSKPHKSAKQSKKEVVPKMTFHRLPKNPERRNAWVVALRRVEWIPNKNSVLCSAHFTEEAFDRTSLSCVRIRDTAVPSIFPAFPAHFQDVEKAGESASRSATPVEDVNTMDVNAVASTCSALPDPLSSLPPAILPPRPSFRRMRRSMSPVESVLRQKLKQMQLQYQKRIKLLQQSERRHVKRIASLKSELTALRKQNCDQ